MKKTLFLSAILGAALCSSAFGASLTTDTSVINGVTYNGGVFTIAQATDNFSSVGKSADVTSTNGTITQGSSISWHAFASNQDMDYGHTVHLTKAGLHKSDFGPFTIGGLIVDAQDSLVQLGRIDGNTVLEINGAHDVNMDIKADTELLGKNDVMVYQGGTWNVASGKTLTLKTDGSHSITIDDVSITNNGGGTIKLDTTAVNVKISETAKTEGNGFGAVVINRQIATGTVDASTVTTWKVNGTTDESLSYNSETNTLTGDSRTTTNYYINDASADWSLTGATTATVNIEGEMGISNNTYTLNTLTINGGTVKSNRSNGTGIITGDIVINGGGKLSIVQGGKDAFGYNGNATKSITLTGTDADHKAVLDLSFNEDGGTTTMSANIVMNGFAEISGNRGFNTFYYDATRAGSITVNGTNNVISSELSIRKASTLTVKEGGELLISGKVSRFGGFDGALTKTGAGTLTITGNITGGSIIGDGAKTIIKDNTISGGTFQNVTFTNAKVNGTITLNNVTGDGKLQAALGGLSKSDAQGATGTINLGGGEYTFNADSTANGLNLVFSANTEINGHGYDSDGHIITLSNGASVNTGAHELKIESEATLKVTNGAVTSGTIILGHNQTSNPGFLSMTGGSITTGFIKSNAGYAASENTFTMAGGTLTFTKPASEGDTAYNAIDGVTATITGGTLSTAQAAWKIDNENVTLSGVTISGANAATLSHVKLGDTTTKIHTDTTVTGGITSVGYRNGQYAFLVENNHTLTFTDADYDLSNSSAGIGVTAGSKVVVESDASLTVKTFVASSTNVAGNGNLTVKDGGSVNVQGGGFRDAYLNDIVLDGSLTVANGATLTTNALTGGAASSLAVNGTVNVGGTAPVTVGCLTLGSNATITVQNHNGSLTTTDLTVNGTSEVNANLVVNGGTITFADNTTLTMGCSVTIGSTDAVTVVLTQDMVDAVATNGYYDLFTSVETATLGNIVFVAADGVTLNDGTAYSLQWDGSRIYVAPEPATATLSLLAFAALCARRKRH
ncbi:MAG: hypothetical protein MJ051_01780 [Akkermansia sp.]|nr:hypothetical protein [Akkermansia sp.]